MSTPRLGWLSGRRRRRIGAALALIAVIAVVVIVVLSAGSSSPSNAAANASTATGAATVQRRDLVETDTESGTLSYADPQTVYNRLIGTITWLPNVGQVIHPGRTLFKIDGKPVVLMDGTTPAYRDLSAADSDGEDILQLNRNLVRLGFNPDGIVVDDVWQPATTVGVELFQASLGESETGVLTLGQIVFLPGDQLISTVDGTVGSTGGGGSSGSNASTTVDPPAPQFVSLQVSSSTPRRHATTSTTSTTSTTTQPATTTPTTSTPTTTTPTTTSGHKKQKQHPSQSQTIAALIQLLRAENAQLQAELRAHHSGGGNGSGSGHSGSGHSGSGHSGSGHSGSGDSGSGNSGSGNSGSSGGSGGTPVEILQTTSTKLVVTVDLSASSQSEAKVGEHVTVQLPDNSTVNGRITAVSPVAQSSSSGNGNGNGGGGNGGGSGNGNGNSSSSTVPVTIAISGHHLGPGLDQAAVSVNFVQQRANHVLSVPVTALVATSGTTYAVQEASPPYKLIPVTTGLFAAGYVEISGPGIYQGLQVTDSQG